MRRVYDVWSHVYDLIWGLGYVRQMRDAVDRMAIRSGQSVLDIGVGTGLALKVWPRNVRVVGIDISEGMLRRARRRLQREQRGQADLTLANALNLPFRDDTFDHILICHVVTVVSDPVRLLREVRRVGRPGCRIVIINHFQSRNRWVAHLERWLRPVFTRIGWDTSLSFEGLIAATQLDVDFRYKPKRVSFYETAFMTNRGQATTASLSA